MNLANLSDREFPDCTEALPADDAIPATLEPVLAHIFADRGPQWLVDAAQFNAWGARQPGLSAGPPVEVREERKVHQAPAGFAQETRRAESWLLSGWLGGPRLFSERGGPSAIPAFHAQWPIDATHSAAWLQCMAGAIARQPYSPEFAEYLLTQLHVPAQRIVQASHKRHAG